MLVVALMLSVVTVVDGQVRPQPPKPSAEHEKLGYFVGDWQTEAEVKPGPFSPGGTFTSTDRGEWLDGGFLS
jgi:hypothetical protein